MRGTFLLALELLGSYLLIKSELSLSYFFSSTWHSSLPISLYSAFKLCGSSFVSMSSYDLNLICLAAIALSFLAKDLGYLWYKAQSHIPLSVSLLASLPASFPSSSRTVYSHEQEIKQRGQKTHRDEQGASTKSQTEEKKCMGCGKRDRPHGMSIGTLSEDVGIQCPFGIEYIKGYQGQQAGLLQLHQQQKEN